MTLVESRQFLPSVDALALVHDDLDDLTGTFKGNGTLACGDNRAGIVSCSAE